MTRFWGPAYGHFVGSSFVCSAVAIPMVSKRVPFDFVFL